MIGAFCISCRTVALWEKIVDRPESYNATHNKNCIFIAQEKLLLLANIYKGYILNIVDKFELENLSTTFDGEFQADSG